MSVSLGAGRPITPSADWTRQPAGIGLGLEATARGALLSSTRCRRGTALQERVSCLARTARSSPSITASIRTRCGCRTPATGVSTIAAAHYQVTGGTLVWWHEDGFSVFGFKAADQAAAFQRWADTCEIDWTVGSRAQPLPHPEKPPERPATYGPTPDTRASPRQR